MDNTPPSLPLKRKRIDSDDDSTPPELPEWHPPIPMSQWDHKSPDGFPNQIRKLKNSHEELERFYFPPNVDNNIEPLGDMERRYQLEEPGRACFFQTHIVLKLHCKHCGLGASKHFETKCLNAFSHHEWSLGEVFVDQTITSYFHLNHSIVPEFPHPTTRLRLGTVEICPRSVVALRCQTVELKYGRECIVRLALVDVMTREVLINALLLPPAGEIVVDWRTATTGLTIEKYMRFLNKGVRLYEGFDEIRQHLLLFMHCRTTVVGYSLRHDLQALKLSTWDVVDAEILYYGKLSAEGKWDMDDVSLERTFRTVLGRDLDCYPYDCINLRRKFTRKSKEAYATYSCVKEAFAARELVLHWKENIAPGLIELKVEGGSCGEKYPSIMVPI